MNALQSRIESFAAGGEADPDAVHEVIRLVDSGEPRVAEKVDGEWVIHEWVRSAILLYFRRSDGGPRADPMSSTTRSR